MAFLSAIAFIPVAGEFAGGSKVGVKGMEKAAPYLDDITELGTKYGNEAAEAFIKNIDDGEESIRTVYRALNTKDAERISQGLGLEAKNPNGTWKLDDHLIRGSGKASWVNDPYISTTTDIDIARGFNKSGSNLGIIEIDLDKVPNKTLKGYEIYPRVNGEAGLPYHYSIWQQEISVYKNIPKEAIKGFVK